MYNFFISDKVLHNDSECYFISTSVCSKICRTIADLSQTERELLEWRSVSILVSTSVICDYHHKHYLQYYENKQTLCCHTFSSYKVRVQSRLVEISLEFAKQVLKKLNGLKIIPGKKMCSSCFDKIKTNLQVGENKKSFESNSSTQLEGFSSSEDFSSLTDTPTEDDRRTVALQAYKISPLKVDNRHVSGRVEQAKRKLNEINNAAEKSLKKVLKLDTDIVLEDDFGFHFTDLRLKKLFEELKTKFKQCSREEQYQILTLFANNFKNIDIQNFFESSRRQVDNACELKEQKGILSLLDPKIGRGLTEEVKKRVEAFYVDETNVRILPGIKDCVSVSKGEKVQKRLILCNLRELFTLYKNQYADDIVGFSSFCSLRPKYCVLPGSSGTH